MWGAAHSLDIGAFLRNPPFRYNPGAAYLGLSVTTFLALVGMATAAYCANIGANAAAVVIGGGDIAALAAIFINGTRIRAKETTEISKDTKP